MGARYQGNPGTFNIIYNRIDIKLRIVSMAKNVLLGCKIDANAIVFGRLKVNNLQKL